MSDGQNRVLTAQVMGFLPCRHKLQVQVIAVGATGGLVLFSGALLGFCNCGVYPYASLSLGDGSTNVFSHCSP